MKRTLTTKEKAAQKLRQAANLLAKAGYFGEDLNNILRQATKLEQEAAQSGTRRIDGTYR